ncbi:hypothetical protein SDC9_189821 [bioreactor metagenome]|uniref:Uncharacterized protein n=1 Tax=bioreactor metagenome TaxID=1076179 RepID=A0A645HT81_9ZZZZ
MANVGQSAHSTLFGAVRIAVQVGAEPGSQVHGVGNAVHRHHIQLAHGMVACHECNSLFRRRGQVQVAGNGIPCA